MIHHSPWQTAPWPDVVDCIITDPPYSARTHEGQRSGYNGRMRGGRREISSSSLSVAYAHITPEQAVEWGRAWGARIRYWIAVMSDHTLMPSWRQGLEAAGLYVFQPVPLVTPNPSPRFAGDGPASAAVYMTAARTKQGGKWDGQSWGSLPGFYEFMTGEKGAKIGGKPLPLMRQIIRDYSRPGMVVADPCCGYGTTLVAAAEQGREVWGCDTDAESVRQTTERLAKVKAQPNLFESPKQLEIE